VSTIPSMQPMLLPTPAVAAYTAPPRGCICPPGANHECRSPGCPRQPLPSVAAQAARPSPTAPERPMFPPAAGQYILAYNVWPLKLIGPFADAHHLNGWGQEWQRRHDDDPRWAAVHVPPGSGPALVVEPAGDRPTRSPTHARPNDENAVAAIRSAPNLLSRLRILRDQHTATDTQIVQELVQAAITQIQNADTALIALHDGACDTLSWHRTNNRTGSGPQESLASAMRDAARQALSSDEARRRTKGTQA
jgi:hypothetical protein